MNSQLAADLFALVDGQLFRRLATGELRPVRNLMNSSTLTTLVRGRACKGAEIAWALHYGIWPAFPLVTADGNPHNMSKENLLPVVRTRLRPKISFIFQFFQHSLGRRPFSSPELAHEDWLACAADVYRQDLELVLARQEAAKARMPSVVAPVRVVRSRPTTVQAPPRPSNVAGRKWHFFEGAWLSVPLACHPADDYMLRCRAVLAGAKSFVFDEEAGKVLAVY